MVMRAAAETLMLACMPEEKAVRALGLYTLHFERPDIIHESPELNTELEELLKPVNASMNNGTQKNLYRVYNPKLPPTVDLFDEAILFCIEKVDEMKN